MRKIFGYVGKYKIYAILTPITVALEVLLEILIPFFMANIIDIGVKNGDMVYIAKTGGIMIAMALLALFFGAISGKYSAVASAGLAKNLRSALFKKMQSFSFSKIILCPSFHLNNHTSITLLFMTVQCSLVWYTIIYSKKLSVIEDLGNGA